jgi:hypothetical protein
MQRFYLPLNHKSEKLVDAFEFEVAKWVLTAALNTG